ncbi:mesenteric estrogen-dependent adipogenesis protein [Myripristis murdjan]|uniref:Mesenteric estrogen-dependent adipogenesis protein n=1 Tax=Myripristis murdjan TaxID=586833 RepID=A0A667X2S4_9TELE|nr:mesenteric estrogen-dependent adipogenesis protein [Myripristis murdjan]
MTISKVSRSKMSVTEVEEFLKKPPAGFTVERLPSGRRVRSDSDTCLVLIDDFCSCRGRVAFQDSLGRKVKMHNLWEYTRVRNSLLSKRIYLLMSACEESFPLPGKKSAKQPRVLKQYVVSIDGNDPYIRWEMERGLDWAISSVAGESYRVDIDLSEVLQMWAGRNFRVVTDNGSVTPVWTDTSFTLKYYSDALFDFPHWLGFSKRKFKLGLV